MSSSDKTTYFNLYATSEFGSGTTSAMVFDAGLLKAGSSSYKNGTTSYYYAWRTAFFTYIDFTYCEIQEFANNVIDSKATGIKGGAYYWPEDF